MLASRMGTPYHLPGRSDVREDLIYASAAAAQARSFN
jgi:hypothetical protein